jgi:hypothetical protein
MNFGLDQRLQVKWRRGERIDRLDNLLSLSIGGSYNFLYREQGQVHPLSTLGSTFRVQPPGMLAADASWVTDVYASRPVRSLSYNIGMNLTRAQVVSGAAPKLPLEQRTTGDVDFEAPWSLSVAYSYAGGYSSGLNWSATRTANGVVSIGLTPAWRMEYSTSFDVTHREQLTQRLGLTRDLHCWVANFTRILTVGGEAEYYFRLGIKEQKEVYVERGTRFGSFGGIQ